LISIGDMVRIKNNNRIIKWMSFSSSLRKFMPTKAVNKTYEESSSSNQKIYLKPLRFPWKGKKYGQKEPKSRQPMRASSGRRTWKFSDRLTNSEASSTSSCKRAMLMKN
jgi:hypothetical protein